MLKAFSLVGFLAVVGVCCAPNGANAALLMPDSPTRLTGVEQAFPISFWAKPYPYGFVPWRRCSRVLIETPEGRSWERVCRTARDVVLRRAY